MPLDIARLFGSEFHARASDGEWRAGLTLWLKSYHQVPAGSLPDDDVALARLAEYGRDLKSWRAVKDGALHGWVKCSDGRLYHPWSRRRRWRAGCRSCMPGCAAARGMPSGGNCRSTPRCWRTR
ncbi:TPA: DUF1376 domain-containing protein [Pseudomonas aeruginosa]